MWYLIDTGFKDPYFNMAYDEYLLDRIEDNEIVFLRFFNFKPESITIGYNQKVRKWLRILEKRGVPWVRRRTGGRAVIHSNDFTYSLIFRRSNPLIGGNLLNSYKKISEGFKGGFDLMDIETSMNRGKSGSPNSDKSPLCFASPSWAELCWNDKKIIGSAQYRRKGRVLQEGTVMLDEPEEVFPSVSGMVSVKEAAGREVSLNEIKESIVKGFENHFDIEFIKFKEDVNIDKYLKKYSSKKWNEEGKE